MTDALPNNRIPIIHHRTGQDAAGGAGISRIVESVGWGGCEQERKTRVHHDLHHANAERLLIGQHRRKTLRGATLDAQAEPSSAAPATSQEDKDDPKRIGRAPTHASRRFNPEVTIVLLFIML